MQPSIDYEALEKWHRQATTKYLEPARTTALRQLKELLDEGIPPEDRTRFRISSSRVKSPQRLLTKLLKDKYAPHFTSYDSIPDVIDDLVGLRLVCNNLSDVTTFQELIGELPEPDSSLPGLPLAIEQESQRDYFAEPKPSGYRAFHVNLVVAVPQTRTTKAVRVEVQVRTLLQDGWGELTHEDTYKPGSAVPEWIITMSSRMAELLAAVDNIAQDLRVGLDAESARGIVAPSGRGDASSSKLETAESSGDKILDEALRAAASDLVRDMATPRPLAAVAQDLIEQFGTDVAGRWAGYGSFKAFISDVCPDSEISGPSPGYIHPPGVPVPEDWELDPDQIPPFIRELRTYVKDVPLISTSRWTTLVDSVAEFLSQTPGMPQDGQASLSQMDILSRGVRESASHRGLLVVLPHVSFVLRALTAHRRLLRGVTPADIREVLYATLIQAAHSREIIAEPYEAKLELQRWMEQPPIDAETNASASQQPAPPGPSSEDGGGS